MYLCMYIYTHIYIYHTAAAIFSRLWQDVPSADKSVVKRNIEVGKVQDMFIKCSCNSRQKNVRLEKLNLHLTIALTCQPKKKATKALQRQQTIGLHLALLPASVPRATGHQPLGCSARWSSTEPICLSTVSS